MNINKASHQQQIKKERKHATVYKPIDNGYQLRDPVSWNDLKKLESSLAELRSRNLICSRRPAWPLPNVGVFARSFRMASAEN